MRFLVITSTLEDKTIDTKKSTSQIFEYSSLNEAILNFRTFQQMSSWKVMYLVVDFETMNQGLGLLKPKDNMEVDSVDLPYFIVCQHTWDKPRSEFIRRDTPLRCSKKFLIASTLLLNSLTIPSAIT